VCLQLAHGRAVACTTTLSANNTDAIAVKPDAVLLCYSLAHGYSQKGFDSRARSPLDRSMHASTAADVATLLRRTVLLQTIKSVLLWQLQCTHLSLAWARPVLQRVIVGSQETKSQQSLLSVWCLEGEAEVDGFH
jgi:hypothetical protein